MTAMLLLGLVLAKTSSPPKVGSFEVGSLKFSPFEVGDKFTSAEGRNDRAHRAPSTFDFGPVTT